MLVILGTDRKLFLVIYDLFVALKLPLITKFVIYYLFNV